MTKDEEIYWQLMDDIERARVKLADLENKKNALFYKLVRANSQYIFVRPPKDDNEDAIHEGGGYNVEPKLLKRCKFCSVCRKDVEHKPLLGGMWHTDGSMMCADGTTMVEIRLR